MPFADYCHLGVDSAYYYYHYKRYAQWQLAKATIDKPLFMTVMSVLLGVLALCCCYFKPKMAGTMSAVGAFLWFWM